MRRIRSSCCFVIAVVAALLLAGGSAPAGAGSAPQGALVAALADERHAAALYGAVILRHGIVAPFAFIFESELVHIDQVLGLFDAYGIDPPADPGEMEEIAVPSTLREACRLAAANERATVALYGRLLEDETPPDVREVFTRLREVARVRHLPAFERCAMRGSGRR